MNTWPVNLVSAFGRGETLALALQESGFDVQVLDFTSALGGDWHSGTGPFPIAPQTYLPAQKQLLGEIRPLKRGITFWLNEGPLELGGDFASFFTENSPAVEGLNKNQKASDFEHDWLRRFMKTWTSAFQSEAWSVASYNRSFPFAESVGLIPATKEDRIMSFERFQTLEYKYTQCKKLLDIQFESSRITELEVEAGRAMAVKSSQWLWCLSSEETAMLGSDVANRVFSHGVRKPEWRWLSLQGHCDRGPWSSGFPEYSVVINDIHLPWAYSNLVLLRWTDTDVFRAWVKVPAGAYLQPEKRKQWADEIAAHLNARLELAKWKVDASSWSVCPHSPVFNASAHEESLPNWKNWDWIAPESTSRLDLSSRLEKEGQSFHRLIQWRNEQIKKQGARGDNPVHTP